MATMGISCPDPHQILNDTLAETLEVMEIEGGGIWLLDDETGALDLVAHRGLGDDLVAAIHGTKVGEGFVGRVAELDRTVVASDSRADRQIANLLRKQEKGRWLVGVPLRSKGRRLGALILLDSAGEEPSDQCLRLLTCIGHQIGLTIDSARLCRQAREAAIAGERRRLASELHDTVVQSLCGMALTARATRIILQRDPERAAAQLARLQTLAQAALADMRSLVFRLRPDSQVREDRPRYVVDLKSPRDLEVELCLEFQGCLSREQVEGLSLIVQEALSNVARHGRTDRAAVTLSVDHDGLSMLVEDQGVGFDPSSVESGWKAMGLATMRERAEILGGTLEVTSRPGEGTKVTVKIPKAREDEDRG